MCSTDSPSAVSRATCSRSVCWEIIQRSRSSSRPTSHSIEKPPKAGTHGGSHPGGGYDALLSATRPHDTSDDVLKVVINTAAAASADDHIGQPKRLAVEASQVRDAGSRVHVQRRLAARRGLIRS